MTVRVSVSVRHPDAEFVEERLRGDPGGLRPPGGDRIAEWDRTGTGHCRLRTTTTLEGTARVLRRGYETEAWIASTCYVLDLPTEQ